MASIKAVDADGNPVYYHSSKPNTVSNPALAAENVVDSITTLTTKLPASLGSTTASASLPVALSSDGPFSTAVGNPSQSEATTDTGSFTVLQFIKRGLLNWTTLLARIPALVSGRIPVDGSGVTQPVSGTVTANAGTGTFAVSGPLTDTQLRASAVPISGTITANTGLSQPLTDTQLRATAVPVSLATAPLPTGASTAANQTTANTSLSSIDGKLGALGQQTMAASTSVVIASNQSAVAVSGPLTDTQLRATAVPVSGTVTANLGTLGGAATETTLNSLNGKFGAIGQQTMAASASVVIASNQSAFPVVPTMSSGGNLSATTAATGTTWTAFGSQALRQLTISNQTGATLEFRQGGAGVGFQVPTANFYTFFGLTNANQIEVRRVDTTNTQVTVTARWES